MVSRGQGVYAESGAGKSWVEKGDKKAISWGFHKDFMVFFGTYKLIFWGLVISYWDSMIFDLEIDDDYWELTNKYVDSNGTYPHGIDGP